MTPITAVNPAESDRFVLRQRWAAFVNRYEFSVPGEDGAPDVPVCFVQQKRFKFKEDIRFYADSTKKAEVMRIKARQRFDPRARYDITDSNGLKIGEIQKVFGESLLRSTYRLYDASGAATAKITESNLAVALTRRFIGFVPRDTYDIDMTGDPERTLDRRLVLAAVVGMDALQAR